MLLHKAWWKKIPFSRVASTLSPQNVTTSSVRQNTTGRPIYLDLQATTPLDPRVLDAMLPYLTNQYGNPHSRTHQYGWEAEKAVETARGQVADLLNADPKEIIFTSGATEANNMSLKGVARFYKQHKNQVITTQTVLLPPSPSFNLTRQVGT